MTSQARSSAPSELVVMGAGGHAKVIVAACLQLGARVVACLDDDPAKAGAHVLGVPVRARCSELVGPQLPMLLAIGHNAARKRLATELGLLGVRFATLVHPQAFVDPHVALSHGVVVFAGAVVQPGTTLGAHAIVNTSASIDHDCHVGDFVHVAPGCHLAGNVTLGEGVFLGVGTSVIPGRAVGEWTTVGAGAAVVRDLPPHVTAVGVPARPRSPARG
jgi:sugar O-acyltransferase (sialic acid O-acetyltransferase NeuD family)